MITVLLLQIHYNNNGIGDACDVECFIGTSTDTPVTIADTGDAAQYDVSAFINDNVIISDINVTVDIDHTWVSDLILGLTSPNGTQVLLSFRIKSYENTSTCPPPSHQSRWFFAAIKP